MDLAIRATRYSIWLHSALLAVLFGLGIWFNDTDTMMHALGAAVAIFVSLLFLMGLRSENRWAAIVFAAICALDLVDAMMRGLNPNNLVNLVDAILSFVVICGVVIWLREQSIARQDNRAS